MAKAGRPTKASDALKDEILDRIADGLSLRKICGDEGMPDRKTIFRWLEDDSDFATKYARAREVQGDVMDEKILEAADTVTSENAAAMRVKIDAYKWRAAKLKPKVYGDKIDVTSGGERIEADPVERATRLASILAAIEKRREADAD